MIKPSPSPLYATKDSLAEAMDYAKSKLPITDANQLASVLGVYHNTLLATVLADNKVEAQPCPTQLKLFD